MRISSPAFKKKKDGQSVLSARAIFLGALTQSNQYAESRIFGGGMISVLTMVYYSIYFMEGPHVFGNLSPTCGGDI